MLFFDAKFLFSFGKGLTLLSWPMAVMPRVFISFCPRLWYEVDVLRKFDAYKDLKYYNKRSYFMCKIFIKLDEDRWGK